MHENTQLAVDFLSQFRNGLEWRLPYHVGFDMALLRAAESNGLVEAYERNWYVTPVGRIYHALEMLAKGAEDRSKVFLDEGRDILLSEDFADIDGATLQRAVFEVHNKKIGVVGGTDSIVIFATDGDPLPLLKWWQAKL